MTREEAIEVYRGLINTKIKEAFEFFVPELAGNEDERIRKELIETINSIENFPNKCAAIAYLEKQKEPHIPWYDLQKSKEAGYTILKTEEYEELIKQKEQKEIPLMNGDADLYFDNWRQERQGSPTKRQCFEEGMRYAQRLQKEQKPLMCDGEIEDKKRDIVAAIRKYYPTNYAEYLTSFLKGLSPEDNSEDEYGQEMLGIAYKLMYEHIPENLRTQEFWDSLKFMREYTGKVAIIHSYEKPTEWGEKHIADIFEKVGLAKIVREQGNDELTNALQDAMLELSRMENAEWSEEDEERAEEIKSYLTAGILPSIDRRVACVEWLKTRLKSLRPQPIQKEAYKDGFQTARHAIALTFMNFLDENRPEGKMGLSNSECEDIDKAFKEGDWAKIMRYAWKYSSPPKQEWSEEDERNIRNLESVLYYAKHLPDETRTELGNFLKSLRPFWKSSEVCYGAKGDPDPAGVWKPSVEQMDALLWCAAHLGGADHRVLAELYEHLKKLM